jgi:asparagine synthase (glutamine-hydrolysing)
MSAIAGLWQMRGGPDASEACRRMLDAQSIYGDFRIGCWSERQVALGRRLARLLPEDVHDEQPLIGGGGEYVLVADARIDNRDELSDELKIPSAQARSMCDSAFILAAFERWDQGCCEHLIGDYAFAVWDRPGQRLVLARDFLGQRPLHFHRGAGFFAFASMPKGLHGLPEIPRAPDEEMMAEFLALMPEGGTRSFYSKIERVETGTIATVTNEGLHSRRYWEWDKRKLTLARDEDYVDGVRQHLDRAVKDRLRGMGGGAVACHLSAGFDSSAVATTAARILAPVGGKVVAFTAAPRKGYNLPRSGRSIGDESELAAVTATLYANIEHVIIRAGCRSPFEALDRNFFLYDRPVLNICNDVWASAINIEARRRKLNILLTGLMGNLSLSYAGTEVFSELISSLKIGRWLRLAVAAHRSQNRSWCGIVGRSLAPWFPLWLWRMASRVRFGASWGLTAYSAINPHRVADLDLHSRAGALFRPWKNGVDMRVWRLAGIDVGNYNKGALAGWGLDTRDPTADRRLIEFCLAVPTGQFYRGGVPKALVRQALADRVPDRVLRQPLGGYQGVDWHEGLTAARDELGEELSRLSTASVVTRALDMPRLKHLLAYWPQAGWHDDYITASYRLALLRGVSCGHFLRRVSGTNS